MRYVCCVRGYCENYKNGPKVHSSTSLTMRIYVRKKWVAAIPCVDSSATKHNGVCELHFPKKNNTIFFNKFKVRF